MKQYFHFIILIVFIGWQMGSVTFGMEDKKVARIAKALKPISDLQWSEIIKNKADTYEVQKGDNLWNVSGRLFGDPHYWPKIWSLNKGITNPHILIPGEKIAFFSGSSESLPQVGAETTPSPPLPPAKVIHEYDRVSQDLWKPLDLRAMIAKDYDSLGFERELRVQIPTRFTFRIPGFVNDSTVPSLGEVTASRRDAVRLSQYEIVFIKSDNQDLQVGSSYSILDRPIHVSEKLSDRIGEFYRTIGEIKIIGIKDKLYVGKVDFDYRTFQRGDRLYPLLPNINDMKPTAAAEALDAVAVAVTNHEEATLSSQYDFIYLDRGVQDGVNLGNVFRFYEHYDPVTGDKLTDQNVMIRADAIVVHTTASFSTALIIRSYDLIRPGDLGVLLTDISDLGKRTVLPTLPEDDLDNLNDHEGLSDKERIIIEQLENWDKTHQGEEKKEIPSGSEQPSTPETPATTEPPSDQTQPVSGDLAPTVIPPTSNGKETLPTPAPENKTVTEGETPAEKTPEEKPAPPENPTGGESSGGEPTSPSGDPSEPVLPSQ